MAQAGELTRNLKDQFLQCKICLDNLAEPKTLPCLHTFCADCIHDYIEHNHLERRKFSCPICRKLIYIPRDGADGFPDSFFLSTLSDALKNEANAAQQCGVCKYKANSEHIKAALLCVDCKMELCEGCASQHNSSQVTQGHTLLPVETPGEGRENHCRLHRGELITFYCETCNSPVCLPCTMLEHKNHRIEQIKDVRQTFEEDMAALILQSKDNIIQLTQTKADLVEIENALFMRKETSKSEIRRASQDMIKQIQEQECHLVNELEDLYDTLAISRDRKRLERCITDLQAAYDFAEQLLSDAISPLSQLINKAEARDSLQKALTYELPDVRSHAAKLDRYANFLPGKKDLWVGKLLQCSGSVSGNTVTSLPRVAPSTMATFIREVKAEGVAAVRALTWLDSRTLLTLWPDACRVRLYSLRGFLVREFGDAETLPQPTDVAVARDQTLLLSDVTRGEVVRLDQCGRLLGAFGREEDLFGEPVSLATDGCGRVFVCDRQRQRVTVHREDGRLLRAVSVAECETPHLLRCSDDVLYLCDVTNDVISLYSKAQDDITFVAKLQCGIQDEAAPSGVADAITPPAADSREEQTAVTSRRPVPATFMDLAGLCVYNNDVLICDTCLNRVHLFSALYGSVGTLRMRGCAVRRPVMAAVSADGVVALLSLGAHDLDRADDPAARLHYFKLTLSTSRAKDPT